MGYVGLSFLACPEPLIIDLHIILEMLNIYKPLPQEHNIIIHFSHQNNLPASTRNLPSAEAFKQYLNTYAYGKPTFCYTGDRTGQVYRTQLRTNCSPLNHYLCHKNIIESPLCSCGQIGTNLHFFLDCT